MEYRLIIHPFAELELEEAKDWYSLQQGNLGNEFVIEIDKIIIRIIENPFQFSKEKKQIRKAVVKRFPYSLFFYEDNFTINIFAVFHSSRNPVIWKKRFENK
ncbi:MAG: type II toxin-antitoxin system RelE/ParE family toxin [Bacteroidota bacterium]|nr:type II toxin-antitoxin system RelE/ParE family toxin [Bacteroidota bacterium]